MSNIEDILKNHPELNLIKVVVKKKAKRNGKVFEKEYSIKELIELTHIIWEGDTYQILDVSLRN